MGTENTMSEQERAQLVLSFYEMQLEIDDVRKRLTMIKLNYPGFAADSMFIGLSNGLYTASTNAQELSDYIQVANAENWKEEKV